LNNANGHTSMISPIDQGTLAQIVRRRAAANGDQIAYTFLADGSTDARSITWAQLDRRAGVLGASLCERGAAGEPVLLALPSGLAFVEALFACWYAGAVAVPVSLPRHQRVKHRLHWIVADAGARFAIGTADIRQRLEAGGEGETAIGGLTWVDAEANENPSAGTALPMSASAAAPVEGRGLALLQYTSGSTGAPRGVVVTHSNLMRNSALIAEACGHGPGKTIVGWLPLFHDMGLVGLVIQAAYSGARCVFMSPERFLMRPGLWLQMISQYGACSSPAPNFAYDLCVDKVGEEQKAGLDLSGWRNALNGSEPVRAATLDRFADAFASCGFRRRSFFPCYGLAEATLFVTGPGEDRGAARRTTDGKPAADGEAGGHVGCGRTFGDARLAIVDPQTARRVPAGAIGEIWVAGESIARGYWNNPEVTAATFNVRPEGMTADEGGDLAWLRTGDLGFIADGELFITGRIRELIIIAGRNHFPVDLERTAESAHPAIATSGAAAFSVDADGVERLVILAEVRREYARPARAQASHNFDAEAVRRHVRAAVAAGHEVAVHDVVLLRPGTLPRTTSGKISRRNAREAYLGKTLEPLAGEPYADAVH
jgi:acyl-CoA synthetase (AMP-forming)/AMP-acid ligase II